jgi:hypothetical protein
MGVGSTFTVVLPTIDPDADITESQRMRSLAS